MLPADKELAQLAVESTRCPEFIILLLKLVAFARRNSRGTLVAQHLIAC